MGFEVGSIRLSGEGQMTMAVIRCLRLELYLM